MQTEFSDTDIADVLMLAAVNAFECYDAVADGCPFDLQRQHAFALPVETKAAALAEFCGAQTTPARRWCELLAVTNDIDLMLAARSKLIAMGVEVGGKDAELW